MGYIGHSPTNAGTFYILDALTMGSGTTYTMQVGGVDVSPSADNLLITLDGVIQHAGDAYTVSGSNIVFASGPGSGVEFYGIIMGQSATVGQGSIGADELKVSGDGTNGQVLVSDGDGTFSWATDTEAYVPLAGGTMTGVLAMGSNNITGTGTIGGTLTTAAQANITSVGTLTGLSSSDHVVLNNNKYFKVKDTTGSAIRLLGLDNSDNIYMGYVDDANGTGSLYLRTGGTNALTLDNSQDATFASWATITEGLIANEGGGNNDVRFESQGNANMFRLDASESRIGIGEGGPVCLLHLRGADTITSGTYGDHIIIGDTGAYNAAQYMGIGFRAIYNSSGNETNIAQIVGDRPDTADGSYNGNLHFLTRTSGSDLQTALTLDYNQSATFANQLRVNGGQASIYGAEGGDAILELNADEADDNADRWQMYVTANNNYLKWRHYGTGSWVDRLWLSSATNNWAFNIIGNSPYGMQITSTSDGASSHDAFVIKRASNAKVFEIFNDGRVHCMKQLHIDTESASVYPSIVGETSDYELFRLEQWYGNEGSLVLKRDGTNRVQLTGGASNVVSFINTGAPFAIGRTTALSPVARLIVASALDGGTTPAMSVQANTSTSSGSVIVFHAGDGTEEGSVGMSNLNAGAGVSYNTSSDYRLKEKVKTLPNALDRVNKMKPVEFEWKKTKSKSEGFLAHELQEICNYAVIGEKDADSMQQVDYAKLTPILVKAIQELSTKVEALENA